MVTISAQSTRTSAAVIRYVMKDPVAISAINSPVVLFEQRLRQVRVQHGKDGVRAKVEVDERGRARRGVDGSAIVVTDSRGHTIYEARYLQAYCLVQSFGPDELDPDDPASWEQAQELGRALAQDRFSGHPVLIVTEVNGRSGCVHNHIVVGAIHVQTGLSLDSNVVTHARLALHHDRVLREHCFEQRRDMQAITAAAQTQINALRARAEADMPLGISATQRRRRLLAAENYVRLKGVAGTSSTQDREYRRRREFDRYLLREQDRAAALDIGVDPEPERFSEIELEARIRSALSDPRSQSWETLSDAAREYRVTIEQRGKDVSYGQMLIQPDGTVAEPSRAHLRRGGQPGSGKGLGDGFRLTDVEAAIQRNVAQHQAATTADLLLPAVAELRAQQQELDRRMSVRRAESSARLAELEAAIDTDVAALEGRIAHRREVLAAEHADVSRAQRTILDNPPTAYRGMSSELLADLADEKVIVRSAWIGPLRSIREANLEAMRDQHELSRDEAAYLDVLWRSLDCPTTADERGKPVVSVSVSVSPPVPVVTTHEQDSGPVVADSASASPALVGEPNVASAVSDQPLEQTPPSASGTDTAQDTNARAPISSVIRAVASARQHHRSKVRQIRATTDNMQSRLDGLAELEETWHGRLPSTLDQRRAFEQTANQIGIGDAVLARVQAHLDPQLHAVLTQRVEQARAHDASIERLKKLDRARPGLARAAQRDPSGSGPRRLRTNLSDARFEQGYQQRIRADRSAGIYDPRPRERMEYLKLKTAAAAAELQETEHQPQTDDEIQ
ncbi:hypothetical protein C8046_16725 [Serinibacter arcticus]|uniref:MobA/VirD2-like nuclease domain-containing protein n=1 Tax=Serinibacter arcticus TaxID=1655435 RepID=A0A2U1ZYP1_9MICO|nr:relaxase/mobilization nuclease domain-containing protein [Serinibacter arcticus]PWD52043.1 hypothetical protein C8046_16725 [Serinibacter arcticus]